MADSQLCTAQIVENRAACRCPPDCIPKLIHKVRDREAEYNMLQCSLTFTIG